MIPDRSFYYPFFHQIINQKNLFMSPKKFNVAIIGLGFGAEFIPIYQKHPLAEMHAICQRTQSKVDEIGDAFGIDKRYTDFDELLKDPDIDMVHINTPIQS